MLVWPYSGVGPKVLAIACDTTQEFPEMDCAGEKLKLISKSERALSGRVMPPYTSAVTSTNTMASPSGRSWLSWEKA
ncbi:hypothetical protein KIN20_008759 [Parelaphostrongylus tenuis]|uniref:Uncharacterized protein n=1 Tax=Parelaphostrongylus tenuis TaxID=148309 RepID=A0AAD5MRL3_PARTN|nr:hypothetical protein KIN20_008759 [Parelaphostrongylus tenuis]